MSITVPASGARIPANVASDTKALRILAIDYGRKRIGLALSDELGITARPLATILRVNRREDLRRLREICRNHSVALIIVGHPLRMSGEAGEMAAEAAGFAKKLEKELTSAKLQRPSALYAVLSKVPGESLVFLLMRSNQRLVTDRIKNYLQKYLPAVKEISEEEIEQGIGKRGGPKYEKLLEKFIAARLDARPKKIVPVEPPPPPPPVQGRRTSSFGR